LKPKRMMVLRKQDFLKLNIFCALLVLNLPSIYISFYTLKNVF
jgi:hypothetical protein